MPVVQLITTLTLPLICLSGLCFSISHSQFVYLLQTKLQVQYTFPTPSNHRNITFVSLPRESEKTTWKWHGGGIFIPWLVVTRQRYNFENTLWRVIEFIRGTSFAGAEKVLTLADSFTRPALPIWNYKSDVVVVVQIKMILQLRFLLLRWINMDIQLRFPTFTIVPTPCQRSPQRRFSGHNKIKVLSKKLIKPHARILLKQHHRLCRDRQRRRRRRCDGDDDTAKPSTHHHLHNNNSRRRASARD